MRRFRRRDPGREAVAEMRATMDAGSDATSTVVAEDGKVETAVVVNNLVVVTKLAMDPGDRNLDGVQRTWLR